MRERNEKLRKQLRDSFSSISTDSFAVQINLSLPRIGYNFILLFSEISVIKMEMPFFLECFFSFIKKKCEGLVLV